MMKQNDHRELNSHGDSSLKNPVFFVLPPFSGNLDSP